MTDGELISLQRLIQTLRHDDTETEAGERFNLHRRFVFKVNA